MKIFAYISAVAFALSLLSGPASAAVKRVPVTPSSQVAPAPAAMDASVSVSTEDGHYVYSTSVAPNAPNDGVLVLKLNLNSSSSGKAGAAAVSHYGETPVNGIPDEFQAGTDYGYLAGVETAANGTVKLVPGNFFAGTSAVVAAYTTRHHQVGVVISYMCSALVKMANVKAGGVTIQAPQSTRVSINQAIEMNYGQKERIPLAVNGTDYGYLDVELIKG